MIDVIYICTTRAIVSPGYPSTRKQCVKTRTPRATVFVNCFQVFGWDTGGTQARVVYMASQMKLVET